ncbi:unnamed protein product [Allacma fusca]|uniref:Retrotransposon gag domain-containing protein n=1 Tax=Allacma fusca TaxID=39272 RepID=A0A8J2P7C1_9HEXA|nr:unnamed protein product [Allacma fusca]
MVRRGRRNQRGRTFSALHLTNTTPIDLQGNLTSESTPVSRNAGTKEVEGNNVSDSLNVNVENIPINLDRGGNVVNALSVQVESEVLGKLQGLFQTIISRLDILEQNSRRSDNFGAGQVRFAGEFDNDWRGPCSTQQVIPNSLDEMIPGYGFGDLGRNDDCVAFGARSEVPGDRTVINPQIHNSAHHDHPLQWPQCVGRQGSNVAGRSTSVPVINQTNNMSRVVRGSQSNGGIRTNHLKTSDISIPKYSGAHEKKTPYDFLIELEKYQKAVGYSEDEMLAQVIPLALIEDAYMWYRKLNSELRSWELFKYHFRREFQSVNYTWQMRRDLDGRFQGPHEPLTKFIYVIDDFFERIDPATPQHTRVDKVMENMHPEYRHKILGRRQSYATIKELLDEAYEAQASIAWDREYKVPDVKPGVEPTLAYKVPFQFQKVREAVTESVSQVPIAKESKLPEIQLSSFNRYQYFHDEVNKPDKHNNNQSRDNRAPSPGPRNYGNDGRSNNSYGSYNNNKGNGSNYRYHGNRSSDISHIASASNGNWNDRAGYQSNQGNSVPQARPSTPDNSVSINGGKTAQTQVKRVQSPSPASESENWRGPSLQ